MAVPLAHLFPPSFGRVRSQARGQEDREREEEEEGKLLFTSMHIISYRDIMSATTLTAGRGGRCGEGGAGGGCPDGGECECKMENMRLNTDIMVQGSVHYISLWERAKKERKNWMQRKKAKDEEKKIITNVCFVFHENIIILFSFVCERCSWNGV